MDQQTVEERYENGNLKCQYGTKLGKRDGKFTQYNEDGTIFLECYYIDGKKNGEEKCYSSVEVTSMGNYIDDKIEGDYITVNHKQNSRKITKYKNGKRNGEEIVYYDGEKIYYKAYYIDGKLNGDYIKYDNNGIIVQKLKYKDEMIVY